MNLNQGPKNIKLRVADIRGEVETQERLRELGIYTGAIVQLLKRAPFKGPWVIQVGDAVLALRDSEAEFIEVETVE